MEFPCTFRNMKTENRKPFNTKILKFDGSNGRELFVLAVGRVLSYAQKLPKLMGIRDPRPYFTRVRAIMAGHHLKGFLMVISGSYGPCASPDPRKGSRFASTIRCLNVRCVPPANYLVNVFTCKEWTLDFRCSFSIIIFI